MQAKEIVNKLRDIAGARGVLSMDDAQAAAYRRCFDPIARELDRDIIAVALPGDVDALQRIVQLAREENLAVWHQPNAARNGISLGRDGGAVVIVDTRHMNRILEVNPASAYALLEPGVSYKQLHDYLKQEKIPLWIDADRDPENSIAGSICTRQVGYTPYGEHFLMQCGMEVVLSNGGLLRTGMGALPGNNTWQLFKYNFGPYIDGLFSQSDLGIPSKIGLWLIPAPPEYLPFMVTLPRPEDLGAVVEILRPLKIGAVIPSTVAISHGAFDTAASGGGRSGFMKDAELQQAALAEKGLGIWNVHAALYGGQDNIDLTWQALESDLLSIDGARIYKGEERGDDPVWHSRKALMGGQLLSSSLDLSAWGGADYMQLTAAAPMEGEFAMQMHHIVRETVAKVRAEYLCEYALSSRTMFKQIYLPYDNENRGSRNKIKSAAIDIAAQMVAAGFSIIGESPELRNSIDRIYGDNSFSGLVDRLRSSLKQQAT